MFICVSKKTWPQLHNIHVLICTCW